MSTITPLPTPPSRGDPVNFAARGDAFLGALPLFQSECNVVAAECEANQVLSSDWANKLPGTVDGIEYSSKYYANASEASADAAELAADAAAAAAGVTMWASGTTYAIGDCVWSPIDFQTYRCKVAGVSSTDPSADAATWVKLTGGGSTGVQLDVANTWTAKQTFSKAIAEQRVAMAAMDINISEGNFFTKTIAAATVFTVSNVPATSIATSFILDLTNGAAFSVTWWANMKWAGGVAPTLTAAGRDVLGFFTHDAGATWTGMLLSKDAK